MFTPRHSGTTGGGSDGCGPAASADAVQKNANRNARCMRQVERSHAKAQSRARHRSLVVEPRCALRLSSPPMPPRLVSLLGLVVFIALAWVLSVNRAKFPWRAVIWGLGLQFFFAWFILDTPIGARLFAGAQVVVNELTV